MANRDPKLHAGATPLTRGSLVDRYVILSTLGTGAMGVVYAAYDPELDRQVALKLLLPSSGDRPRDGKRLLREAQALARLSHPNVVAVHDAGRHADQVFVAMELVSGRTLRAWLADHTRTVPEIVDTFVLAGRGLAAAHERGLTHRDFKPDNVMVDDDGRVRVMDFGLADGDATATASDSADVAVQPREAALGVTLTRRGAVVGTPAYLAPEQLSEGAAGPLADQFSFCVSLWEALYGTRPFHGETLVDLSKNILDGRILEPAQPRAIPRWIRSILERGLELDPARRFESMTHLCGELASWRARRRRRRVLGVIGTLTALGVAGWLGTQAARRIRATECDDAAAAGHRLWADDVRTRVRDAMIATGIPHAPASFERADGLISDKLARWTAAYTESCRRGLVEHSIRDTEWVRRRECFEDRLASLASLVAVWETESDTAIVGRIVPAAAKFSPVGTCTDDERLARSAGARPSHDARVALRDAAASEALGRYSEGLDALSDELERLEGTDPASRSALAAVAGRLADGAGDYARAHELATTAFDAALSHGDVRGALDAATTLVFVAGVRLARYEEGHWWARIAQDFVRSEGLEGSLEEAGLLDHLGNLQSAEGRYEAAAASLGHAAELYATNVGDETIEHAGALVNLAMIASARSKPDEAQQLLERARSIEEKILGPTHPGLAETYRNLASVYDDQGRADEALRLHHEALRIRRASLGPTHPEVAAAHNSIANTYQSMDRYEDALPELEAAAEILEAAHGRNHPHVAVVYNNLGNVLMRLDRLADAEAAHLRALEIKRQVLRPAHPDIGISHANLGKVHRAQERFADAAHDYELAAEIFEAALGPTHPHVSTALVNFAAARVAEGSFASAVDAARRAVDLRAQNGASKVLIADAQFVLAQALWADRSQRARALSLGHAAREAYAAGGEEERENRDEVDRWLSTRADP